LIAEYGRGYSQTNLSWMTRFAEVFPDEDIVAALSQQLSWSHFVQIIPLDNPLKRDFYAEMCRVERWSTRTLRHKIDHLLFERTAVAKKPEQLIEQDIAALRDEDRLTPDIVFRGPYFLDFLGLTELCSNDPVCAQHEPENPHERDRPLPDVYYDPRSLDVDLERRACLHAKCVVVDRQHVFVSSANFTEAAQERNIEVGVLVRSPRLAEQLTNHFDSLLAAGFLREVFQA
jgi:phosphatidylserine/phosphatidylglycerophosphate/cardiolipin synthase-like enzyme